MVTVRSDITSTFIAAGRPDSRLGSSLRTESTVAMTLAPGWRWTLRMIAGVLPAQAAILLFSAPLTTLATSDSRTGAPLRKAMIWLA